MYVYMEEYKEKYVIQLNPKQKSTYKAKPNFVETRQRNSSIYTGKGEQKYIYRGRRKWTPLFTWMNTGVGLRSPTITNVDDDNYL